MDPSIITRFGILIVLLLLSAFFSSAETALTTVNRIKLINMADEGDKRAQKTLQVIEHPKKMLSAILIGNNIVNLSASSLATTLAVDLLGSMGAGIATGILTLLVLIFGEITPKSLATIHSLEISLGFSNFIWVLMIIFTPVIVAVNFVASLVIRLFGVDPNLKEEAITEDEIRTMVNVSHESGEIEHDEKQMIHKVFDFTDATAKEIMIPRIDMQMIDKASTYEEIMEAFQKDMYTRMPVCDKDTDHIVGMINIKDMIFASKQSFDIDSVIRPVYFTYEQKKIAELFDELREQGIALSIVLDEYGSVAGLLTLEDLIEEIVGEIKDEFDADEEDPLKKINDREYIALGSMNLEDLCDILPLGFESEDYDTIGGFLTGEFDHFPAKGETYVSAEGVIIRVLDVDNKRITKIKIKLPQVLAKEVDEEDLS